MLRTATQRDGRIDVHYPMRPALVEAFAEAHRVMTRIQLAAGARVVSTTHVDPVVVRREADVALLEQSSYGLHRHSVFTAHQMGGCVMGTDPERSVVDCELRHHHVPNLFVVDGSVLPTGLGVNPSETIYGLSHRARDWVAGAV